MLYRDCRLISVPTYVNSHKKSVNFCNVGENPYKLRAGVVYFEPGSWVLQSILSFLTSCLAMQLPAIFLLPLWSELYTEILQSGRIKLFKSLLPSGANHFGAHRASTVFSAQRWKFMWWSAARCTTASSCRVWTQPYTVHKLLQFSDLSCRRQCLWFPLL